MTMRNKANPALNAKIVKYLGILLDKNLSFKNHIDQITINHQ